MKCVKNFLAIDTHSECSLPGSRPSFSSTSATASDMSASEKRVGLLTNTFSEKPRTAGVEALFE